MHFQILNRCHVARLSAALLLATAAYAGDLDPPPGPVMPTMKTLTEVEPRKPIASLPYTISASGSYYLTQDLTGLEGQNGIFIEVDDVTIDLNGFALIGVPGSGDGVGLQDARKNILIRNGIIKNWAGDGIDLADASNSQLHKVRADGNGQAGLKIGHGGIVNDCTAAQNGGTGIQSRDGAVIENCTATSNLAGFGTGEGCMVRGCTAWSNTTSGFGVGKSLISHCQSSNNGHNGILATDSQVESCVVVGNTAHGIEIAGQAGQGSVIRNCFARLNGGAGITAANQSVIIGNTCHNNSKGIRMTGNANHVEGNNVLGNSEEGIWLDGGGDNVIIKNTAIGNGVNYHIVGTGNIVGTVTNDPTTAGPWANASVGGG